MPRMRGMTLITCLQQCKASWLGGVQNWMPGLLQLLLSSVWTMSSQHDSFTLVQAVYCMSQRLLDLNNVGLCHSLDPNDKYHFKTNKQTLIEPILSALHLHNFMCNFHMLFQVILATTLGALWYYIIPILQMGLRHRMAESFASGHQVMRQGWIEIQVV